MSLAKVNKEWIPLQTKVFTRWVNFHLQNNKVEDITKDLSNGIALIELSKVLTRKGLTRQWCPNPKRSIEMVQNCDLAIEMFEKDGVKLVGISGKDINDNNTKLILGLIWSLILHYSIGKSINEKTNKDSISTNESEFKKDALMSWAISRTANYPNIKDFAPYGLSICALLDSYFPSKINYYSLNPKDTENNSKLAANVMNELGIPVYIYPEEISKDDSNIDKKALLTQLSTAKVVLDNVNSNNVHEKSAVISDNLKNPQSEIEKLRKALDEANSQIQKERKLREIAESNLKEITKELKEVENEKNEYSMKLQQTLDELHRKVKDQKSSDDELSKLSISLTKAQYEIQTEKEQNLKIQKKIKKLMKINKNAENEKYKLERKIANLKHELFLAKKENKSDDSLLQKLSIDLTEKQYENMELKEDDNLIEKIVNFPKNVYRTVVDNINEADLKMLSNSPGLFLRMVTNKHRNIFQMYGYFASQKKIILY